MNPYTRAEKYPPLCSQKQFLGWGVIPRHLARLSSVPGKAGHREKEKTMTEDTAHRRRDWFKIALFVLLPALALGLVALGGRGDGASEAEAAAPTTTLAATQTTTTEAGAEGEAEELEQDVPEQPESEQPEPDEPEEPEDPPTPAQLEVPASVTVGGGNVATIEIGNSGEMPLDIFEIDTNGFPLTVGDVPGEIEGGSTETLSIEVDTTDLDDGPYTMTIGLATSGGVAEVDIVGTKFGLVFVPPTPDVDVSTDYVLPDGANILTVKMVNNEGANVTVDLSTDDDRLTVPASYELVPGENEVPVFIAPMPVAWNVIDILELTVSHDGVDMATVTITKYGS